ncbi:SDR family NAD(P)-dependent oxidoreductase [Yinghuangia sp. YIM S09857]|uniref:SDR family NAD(P)-dependent oxidoreductase n=1 Tax=Yinghuangia sp. YIM S09857 TaxID=3436929 RepID=UPI003F52E1D2
MPGLIIVGAGPLIGRSVARRFAREGLPVAVVARGSATAEETAAAVRGDGGRALALAADATDEKALRTALDTAVDAHGVPDAVVYNAGLIRADRLGDLSADEFLATLAVNVVGVLTTAAHLGPRMAAAGRGTFLVTGGMPQPLADYLSLSLGKAGVRAATDMVAQELGPSGVHVTTVTVAGEVRRGTAYDPDDIAEQYWELHRRPEADWQREVLYAR